MVGMNAVVMDGAVVGEESIVAAMSFVKAKMIIPPRSLVMGSPAKVARELTDEDVKWKSFGTKQYHDLNVRSLQTMREVEAFTEPEPDRRSIEVGPDSHKPKA
jgi:phenylacetic acid degradation protein